jgi:hypothetical protein
VGHVEHSSVASVEIQVLAHSMTIPRSRPEAVQGPDYLGVGLRLFTVALAGPGPELPCDSHGPSFRPSIRLLNLT